MLHMMQPFKCVETNVVDLLKCKLVYELADPEFTPVCAESQRTKRERHKNCPLRNFAGERGFMSSTRPL